MNGSNRGTNADAVRCGQVRSGAVTRSTRGASKSDCPELLTARFTVRIRAPEPGFVFRTALPAVRRALRGSNAAAARLRALVAVAAALLAWTLQDIAVWGLLIERRHQDHDALLGARYQALHQAVLVALVVAGVLYLSRTRWLAGWYAGAVWTLAYAGPADLGYYALALRPQPGAFPWLDDPGHLLVLFHPATGAALLGSSVLWLTFWALMLVAPAVIRRAARAAAAPPGRGCAVRTATPPGP